jgi:hypothetical protein
MEQQNNNKNQQVDTENPVKDDDILLAQEDIEYFKSVPTNIHVVYSKTYNRVLVQKTNTVFTTEEEAEQYAETLAVSVSGLNLNFWGYGFSDIAVKYVFEDLEEIGVTHRITIYPKNNA